MGAVGLGCRFVETPLRPQGGRGLKQVVGRRRVPAAQDAPAGITSRHPTPRALESEFHRDLEIQHEEGSRLTRLVKVLREMAKSDEKLANVLRNFSLL